MTLALLGTIVAILMISVFSLLVTYTVAAVRHDRWRRRAPVISAGRAALAEIAARGPTGAGSLDPEQAPPATLATLRGAELARLLTDLALSVDGDSLIALRNLAAQFGLIAAARHQLDSRTWVRRLAAARFLTAMAEPLTPDLNHLFADRATAVRNQMAVWAAISKDSAPVAQVVGLLADRDGRCRFAAKDALVRVGTRSTVALGQILADPRSPAVTAALEVAAALGDPSFAAPAVRIAGSRQPRQRALAAAVLGSSGGPATAAALRALLRDEDSTVRRAAIAAIALQGDWSAATTVADLLDDPSWPVRRDAGGALLRLGAPGLILLRDAARSTGAPADIATQTLQIHGLATGRAA